MNRFFLILLCNFPFIALSQFTVAYHQSKLPFVGINYEIGNKFRPEIRIGTDSFLKDVSLEAALTYVFVSKQYYELYTGLGLKTDEFGGLLFPIGVNMYPFELKNFGFHIELAPILIDTNLLRGSWGIRYRFTEGI